MAPTTSASSQSPRPHSSMSDIGATSSTKATSFLLEDTGQLSPRTPSPLIQLLGSPSYELFPHFPTSEENNDLLQEARHSYQGIRLSASAWHAAEQPRTTPGDEPLSHATGPRPSRAASRNHIADLEISAPVAGLTRVLTAARTAFQTAEKSSFGYLNFKEFLDALASLKVDMPYHHRLHLFRNSDSNHDGWITQAEFCTSYVRTLLFSSNVCSTSF